MPDLNYSPRINHTSLKVVHSAPDANAADLADRRMIELWALQVGSYEASIRQDPAYYASGPGKQEINDAKHKLDELVKNNPRAASMAQERLDQGLGEDDKTPNNPGATALRDSVHRVSGPQGNSSTAATTAASDPANVIVEDAASVARAEAARRAGDPLWQGEAAENRIEEMQQKLYGDIIDNQPAAAKAMEILKRGGLNDKYGKGINDAALKNVGQTAQEASDTMDIVMHDPRVICALDARNVVAAKEAIKNGDPALQGAEGQRRLNEYQRKLDGDVKQDPKAAQGAVNLVQGAKDPFGLGQLQNETANVLKDSIQRSTAPAVAPRSSSKTVAPSM